ncbi:hypothetical protein SAMN04515695_0163 [Pseudovibrio sp. Tun.PSC04-5.I4]|nr:hypothetical protein SAMN04515695_0163 [Pseudovibrio sp. Tun.PSC04-5.I4]
MKQSLNVAQQDDGNTMKMIFTISLVLAIIVSAYYYLNKSTEFVNKITNSIEYGDLNYIDNIDITDDILSLYSNDQKKIFEYTMRETQSVIADYNNDCACWVVIADVKLREHSILGFTYASETARFVFEFRLASIVLNSASISKLTL